MPIARGLTMKALAAAAALAFLIAAAPTARAADDDDCDTAVENVDDAVQIASQALQSEMADIGKRKPAAR